MLQDQKFQTIQKKQNMGKANYLTTAILFILVILSSCKNANNTTATNPQFTEISSDEKESAKKEISGRIDEIIKGVKELNVDVAIKPYSSNTSFRIVNTDASVTDYQTMKTVKQRFSGQLKVLALQQ